MIEWFGGGFVPAVCIYALVFWVLALRWPSFPLALIFGLAPFQNDLSGIGGLHFSLSEIHLLLSIPLLFFRRGSLHLNVLLGVLLLGLLTTLLITLPNWRESSAVSLIQMGLYWVGAVLMCSTLPQKSTDLVLAWNTLLVVGGFLAVTAVVSRSSYFLGLNKNGIGASLACSLVVCVERWITAGRSRKWLYASLLILFSVALILVLSRGSWISALSGVVFVLVWRSDYKKLVWLVFASIPIVVSVWMFLPSESRDYVTGIDDSRYNIHARTLNTDFARLQWESSPWIGVGTGLRKEYDATNVLWLTLAETGPVGLLCFLIPHFWVMFVVWRYRSRASDDSIKTSAVVLAGALLLGKLLHGMVDHYWSRGAIMIAWSAVGMALAGSRKIADTQRKGIYRRERVGKIHWNRGANAIALM